jgi:hypothetical protein
MPSQHDSRIAMARERLAKGRKIIGQQKCVVDIKREAGMDVASPSTGLQSCKNLSCSWHAPNLAKNRTQPE